MKHDESILGDCWLYVHPWNLIPVRVITRYHDSCTVEDMRGLQQSVSYFCLVETKAIGKQTLSKQLRKRIADKEKELKELYTALAKVQEL